MKILLMIAAAAFLLAAVIFLAGFAAFYKAMGRKKITVDGYLKKSNSFWYTHQDILHNSLRACEGLAYTETWTTSFDGLRLYARYYDCGKKEKLIILLHGYRSMSSVDFGSVLRFYLDLGYNILLVDQRAHGKSEGKYICFGAVERYDVPVWVEHAVKHYAPEHIVLDGISMGAATVLMASNLPMDERVRGIIADSAFSSPWDIVADVARKDYHVPEHPVVDMIAWYARKFAGFDMKQSAEECVKHSNLPILFIHGTADGFVPCYMTERAYAVCSTEKSMVLVEGAEHGMSYLKEPERIREALKKFLNEHVK